MAIGGIPNQYPGAGYFNTNSFLSSGLPYLTGSTLLASNFSNNNAEVKIQFPRVARSFFIVNRTTTDIRVHFNSISDGRVIEGHHYFSLTGDRDSVTFVQRVTEVYISLASSGSNGQFELVAELTNIPADDMRITLTGSGLTE